MIQGCFKGIKKKFKGCFKKISKKVSSVFLECFNEVLFYDFVVAWISSQLPEQKEGLFSSNWDCASVYDSLTCWMWWLSFFCYLRKNHLVFFLERYFMQPIAYNYNWCYDYNSWDSCNGHSVFSWRHCVNLLRGVVDRV